MAAPSDGNLTILVTGERFDDFGDVQCKFGAARVPGIFHHQGAITCVAPPVRALCEWSIPTGTHARRGNYGRVAATYGGVGGRHTGGTGAGGGASEPPSEKCIDQLGGLSISFPVEVSFNGVDFTKGSPRAFTWYDKAVVALSDIHPRAGPASGGTRVTIRGDGFLDYGD